MAFRRGLLALNVTARASALKIAALGAGRSLQFLLIFVNMFSGFDSRSGCGVHGSLGIGSRRSFTRGEKCKQKCDQ
jgi:hypothetical protein